MQTSDAVGLRIAIHRVPLQHSPALSNGRTDVLRPARRSATRMATTAVTSSVERRDARCVCGYMCERLARRCALRLLFVAVGV